MEPRLTDGAGGTDGALPRAFFPLHAFARGHGRSAEDAGDRVQDFFLRVIEKNVFDAADPARGRFRSFLLASFKHALLNDWRDANRLKRGGAIEWVPLDLDGAEQHFQEKDRAGAQEVVFDRKWALALVEWVLGQLRAQSTEREFEVLKPYVASERGEVPMTETAAQLGVNLSAAKSRINRFRQRWARLTREEVARTVENPAEVEDELRHLLNCRRA